MARKEAPEMKTTVVQARVTERELQLFRKLAKAMHMDLAELIRQRLWQLAEEKGIAA